MRITSIAVLILLLTISSSLFLIYFKDKPQSDMSLPVIAGPGSVLDLANIKAKNKPYIISVFASWCETCLKEHEVWMRIAEENAIDLYGIDYIDIENKALEWLQTHGNPYLVVAADYTGKLAKKLKITGVPETLVFDRHGNLLAHISGEVTMEMWNNRISRLVMLQ